jgi:hypothetical protein
LFVKICAIAQIGMKNASFFPQSQATKARLI